MLPAEDAAGSTAEVRRLADRGDVKQVSMHIARVASPIYDDEWLPFWDAIEESGIIASFHLVLTKAMMTGSTITPGGSSRPARSSSTSSSIRSSGCSDGACSSTRPNVRLVLAESGLGWPPWVVQEMDYRYRRLLSMGSYWDERGGIGLSAPPSEVFRRQVWVTFQDDQIGLDILHHFGDDKVMWACDYPHPDSTFPESREVIERLMTDVPEAAPAPHPARQRRRPLRHHLNVSTPTPPFCLLQMNPRAV